ncbi:MAG: hypothetical protein IKY94_14500 [Lachnospiraceae bacterium]|nr:hypothetical protein [Lachnospiraceae bacterium]
MKQKRRNKGSIAKAMLAIAVATALTIGGVNLSYALIDETNSVHIRASEIEDATLIIGTHLIYLGSMNQQIYETAMKSAEESNQYSRYYKSELAGGVWYEITEAGSLADITTSGVVVENSVIEALYITHHTKADGITYDLVSGGAVSVFDINNPYDLTEMTELNPIKLQYDMLVQTEEPSETMERDILYIKEIYQVDRQTDRTREIDAQMKALQEYHDILIRDGAEEANSDQVMSVIEKLDASRRAEVFRPLNEIQLQNMSQAVGREYKYVAGEIIGEDSAQEDKNEREKIENFVPNSDLLTAISESMTNVQESYISYSSNMLAEGNTILAKAEYEFSMELINHAMSQNYAGCDECVQSLIYLERINDSVIREESREREFIEQKLLQDAIKKYQSSLGSGVANAYTTLPNTAAAATKANVLKNQLNETEIVRNELQFIFQAYIDRMTPENAKLYIASCIDNMEDYRNVVKEDAYKTYAYNSIDSHLDWLSGRLKELQSLLGDSSLDKLKMQKNDLQLELMTALDNNRLDEAKKIEAQREAIDMEIDETENYLNSVLNSEYASDSEKALAAAQLSDGSMLASLQNMKKDAIANIKNGDLDGVDNILDGISAMGEANAEATMGALEDIYQELSNQELMGNDSSKLKDLINQVEEIAAEQISNLSQELSEEAMAKLIQTFFFGKLTDGMTLEEALKSLNEEQFGVMLAGLSMYTRQTNAAVAEELLNIYSKAAFNSGNRFLYEQLKNESLKYVPTDKLAKITGYRYVFNDSQKVVILQKGSRYFQFEAFSRNFKKGNDLLEMTMATGFQNVIYISEEVARESFEITTEYLYKTSLASALTEEMKRQAQEFADVLLEAGGEH